MRSSKLKFAAMAIVSVLILNVFVVENAQAQFSLGLKVAGNTVNYKKLTENDFGLEAGIFLRFGYNFFFQPEVNYAFKKSTFLEQYVGYSPNGASQ